MQGGGHLESRQGQAYNLLSGNREEFRFLFEIKSNESYGTAAVPAVRC